MTNKSLKFLFALPLVALPVSIMAQPVFTDPVGAVSEILPAGAQVKSLSLTKASAYQGAVQSVDGTTVGLSGVSSVSGPSYLHVLSGAAAGSIVSIDSFGLNSVVIASAVTGLSVDDTVAIREHNTLADLASYIGAVDGDVVTLFNPDGSSIQAEYFDGFGWYDESADAVVDSLPIYPGEGFSLTLNGSREAVFIGTVSTNPVNVQFGAGVISLVGTMSPVAGQEIGGMFPSFVDEDSVSFYVSSGGNLVQTGVFSFFDGFGFYDEATDTIVDDAVVLPGTAIVVSSSSPGFAVLEPAFVQP